MCSSATAFWRAPPESQLYRCQIVRSHALGESQAQQGQRSRPSADLGDTRAAPHAAALQQRWSTSSSPEQDRACAARRMTSVACSGSSLDPSYGYSLWRRQRSCNEAIDSARRRGSAFHQHVVVSNTARLLPHLRCKHLLHVRLTAEIRDLSLSSQKGIGTGRAQRNLILHLISGLKNRIGDLIRDQRGLQILLTQCIVHVHHHAV